MGFAGYRGILLNKFCHFSKGDAGDGTQDVPGRLEDPQLAGLLVFDRPEEFVLTPPLLVDLPPAAQVAGVVVGDPHGDPLFRPDRP